MPPIKYIESFSATPKGPPASSTSTTCSALHPPPSSSSRCPTSRPRCATPPPASSASPTVTSLTKDRRLFAQFVQSALSPTDSDCEKPYRAATILSTGEQALEDCFLVAGPEGQQCALPLLFKFLQGEELLNQTAAGYFLKINKSLIQNRADDYLEVLTTNNLLHLLLKHVYNPSILQLYGHLLEKEVARQKERKEPLAIALADAWVGFSGEKLTLFIEAMDVFVKEDLHFKGSLNIARLNQVVNFTCLYLGGGLLRLLSQELERDSPNLSSLEYLIGTLARIQDFYSIVFEKSKQPKMEYYEEQKSGTELDEPIPENAPFLPDFTRLLAQKLSVLLRLSAKGPEYTNSAATPIASQRSIRATVLKTVYVLRQHFSLDEGLLLEVIAMALKQPFNNIEQVHAFNLLMHFIKGSEGSPALARLVQEGLQGSHLTRVHLLRTAELMGNWASRLEGWQRALGPYAEVMRQYGSFIGGVDPSKREQKEDSGFELFNSFTLGHFKRVKPQEEEEINSDEIITSNYWEIPLDDDDKMDSLPMEEEEATSEEQSQGRGEADTKEEESREYQMTSFWRPQSSGLDVEQLMKEI